MKIILVFTSLFYLIACAPKRLAVRVTSGILETGAPAIEQESEVEIAKEASLISLKQMEAFSFSDPHNKKLLTLLARGYGSYAFGFVEEDRLRGEKGALENLALFYTRGRDYGLRALPQLKKGMTFPEWSRTLSQMGKKNLSALFWTAFNWGGLIQLKPDDPQNLVDFAKVEKMMKRVEELNPDYFYGSVHAFFGTVLAMKPTLIGGNPAEAKKRFEKAIEVSGGKFLMHYILYAQFYAGHLEPSLKRELLRKVLEAPEGLFPEQALVNALAKRRAKLLYIAGDDGF